MRNYIIIFLLLFSGCSQEEKWEVNPFNHAVVSTLVAKHNTLSSAINIPFDPKVGDKCPECNDPPGSCGVGKVGDGRVCVVCEKCGGNGIINEENLKPSPTPQPAPNPSPAPTPNPKPEPAPQPQLRNEIIMYSRANCIWCDRWEKEVMPKMIEAKWKVFKVNDNQNAVPHFEMYIKGEKKTHRGYMSIEQFKKYYDEVIKKN